MKPISKSFVASFLALILLLAVCTACGRKKTKQPTTAPNNPPAPTEPSQSGSQGSGSTEIKACLDSIPVYANAQEVSRDDNTGTRAFSSQDGEGQVADFYRNNPPGSPCTQSPGSRSDPGALRMTCAQGNLNLIVYVHLEANRGSGTAIDFTCTP